MTLHIPEVDQHHCVPPAIETWESWDRDPDGFPRPPELVDCLPEGTRFHCPCGEVWYVVRIAAGRNGYVAWAERCEWRPETNVQRLLRRMREGRS